MSKYMKAKVEGEGAISYRLVSCSKLQQSDDQAKSLFRVVRVDCRRLGQCRIHFYTGQAESAKALGVIPALRMIAPPPVGHAGVSPVHKA